MVETVHVMRDHWWWRPGWRVGRSFYTWHVTFEDQPSVHQLAADYTPMFDGLPTLDPIPVRWLHLTMQGIGFTDEVDRADVGAIVDAARCRCAALAPFTVTLGPARVDPEALMLPVRPPEPVVHLRAAIRAAIADVRGPDNVPEDSDDFRPHVSLAYSNAAGPAGPIAQRLTERLVTSAEITVHRATLIDLNRDHKVYRWTDIAAAELGIPTG
ncbi:MAG: 2'-5' RNA ligase family protein [Pseudonocardiales bacterium]|nr:2'-5' RNA ligase family protein [Pseudonocardiales bacterium]MBV9029419.1 2'-5' RNA ligase family protein [Pseudonocardiales bacterium]MBW0009568.1 2'-5' RNA ligase family protein [Pseudonocardiales bacterium]